MRYIKIAFWGLVAICLIVVGMANAEMVRLDALPDWLASLLGVSPQITLPLYMVIFAGVAFGLLVGFVWEWLREHKHRVAMQQNARDATQLAREVDRLKKNSHQGDDVLALLDAPAK